MKAKMKAKPEYEWRELSAEARGEFQNIVKLLVEFDERTGRATKYDHEETHWVRKSISVANPDNVRFFIQEIDSSNVYLVIAMVHVSGATSAATSWIHEDGIFAERKKHADDKKHPVHTIVCLTDLVEKKSSPRFIGDLPEMVKDVMMDVDAKTAKS